ncbi:hypothetical protein ACFFU9_14290 [Mariniflexile ostreae]|uniref:Uncharacterized protein n=1 Tax=Mariniflexile ostreae TaxID=1520892 RepID=A0ABV5FEM1_9FLAO
MAKYYILLVLLISFSLASAENQKITVEVPSRIKTVRAIGANVATEIHSTWIKETVCEDVPIDSIKKKSIVKSTSDIRLYLNRLRNVDHISLMFPQKNKIKLV